MDCSLPGFSVHGIFQARVLEWGAIAFSDKKASQIKKKKTNLVRCQRAYYSACSFLWLKFDFLREQEVFEDNVKNVTKYYCCTLSWFLIFS